MTRYVRRAGTVVILLAGAALAAGCYPRYDWRDFRPDCAKYECGFVATFPGRPTSATRDIPIGPKSLPLTVHVVSVGDVTFAVTIFALGSDADVPAARATLEKKLFDDVGATEGTRRRIALVAADRTPVDADALDATGRRGDRALRAAARFAVRRDRLVEMLVIGPDDVLTTDTGRQAIETFLTSLRLD